MHHLLKTFKSPIKAYNSYSYILPVLAILLGLSAEPAAVFAQTATPDKETPALVIPAEDASDAQKKAKEMPSLSSDTQHDDSRSLSGAFLSSYVAHNEGNLTQARRYLKDAFARDPKNEQIAGQILVLDITLGYMDDAINIATKLAADEQHELIVDLLLAIDAVKHGNPLAGKEHLNGATSNSFDHIWLPLLLEWTNTATKREKPVAIEDIIDEKEDVPSFVHYHIALLNDMYGFKEEAATHYHQAISDIARAPFRALVAYSNMKARNGDMEAIQQLLIELTQQRPDMEKLLRAELPYINDLGNEIKAPEPFISSSAEGVSEVLLTMASMLYTLDISQDIPLYLQMAIYLRPDFPTAQLMLGNYFESLSLWDEANEQYKSIRKSSPLYLKSAIRRMNVMEQTGQKKEASTLARALTREFPNSLEVWVAAGDLERGRADFDAAIDYYDKAIDLLDGKYHKQHWFLFFARGACYERQGKWAQAETNLRQARNLSPQQPEVLNYIGYMWLEQDKRVFEAVKLIEKAYKLSPHEPHIVDSMGWAFFKTGRLPESIAMLEHAAEMLPNDATINEHLGDAYWHADRILEARYQWLRAKDFSEGDKQTIRLEQKIKDGLSTYSFHTPPISQNPADANRDDENVSSDQAAPATIEVILD